MVVEVHEAVDSVVLNAIELEIDRGWLFAEDGERLEVSAVVFDEETQRAQLDLSAPAGPGRWTLHLEFRGTLNDQLHGFYRSTYTDDDDQMHTIATTQFEAADARRAFPAGMSPTSRRCSGSRWWYPTGSLPSRAAPRSPGSPSEEARFGCGSQTR